MALSRENHDAPYVSGRMIAIAERYAGDKFGPGTLSAMFTHPAEAISAWRRYIDPSDEYYSELAGIELPVTLPSESAKGRAWVGYYHQKAAYGKAAYGKAAYGGPVRGGRRPGAGRKPVANRRVSLSARVLPETLESLKKKAADGHKSVGGVIDGLMRPDNDGAVRAAT